MATTDMKPTIPDEVIDQLLAGLPARGLTGKDGILKQLTARLVERALQAEITEHLGYDKGSPPRAGRGATRIPRRAQADGLAEIGERPPHRVRPTRHSPEPGIASAKPGTEEGNLAPQDALFHETLNGAHVGNVLMSLIHSAALNRENAFDYLVTLRRHREEVAADPAAWMPWNYRETLGHLVNDRGSSS